ncbi:hypothetical protein [Bacillus sp. T3]|uniref:hypothetical protein n=1 Tax=Bacillus sp. T3 TaxID=467262 RepID=UPI0029811157|nr:hypothetical protein [Bacillus sp. T3]
MAQKFVNFLAFVAVIAGVIFYSNYEDEVKAKNQLTNKQAIEMTKEIVKTQGPLILKDLGVKDDGILNRITIDKGVRDDDYAGLYTDRTYTTWNDSNKITYDEGTNTINLYPFTYLTERDENGDPIFLSKDQYPSKVEFRRSMIETLAHELRHYYQDRTGESIKHPYDESIPHDERWAEKDSNKYMEKYYKSLQNK